MEKPALGNQRPFVSEQMALRRPGSTLSPISTITQFSSSQATSCGSSPRNGFLLARYIDGLFHGLRRVFLLYRSVQLKLSCEPSQFLYASCFNAGSVHGTSSQTAYSIKSMSISFMSSMLKVPRNWTWAPKLVAKSDLPSRLAPKMISDFGLCFRGNAPGLAETKSRSTACVSSGYAEPELVEMIFSTPPDRLPSTHPLTDG